MKHPEGDFPTPASENADGTPETTENGGQYDESAAAAVPTSEWAAPRSAPVASEWQAPGSFSAPAAVPERAETTSVPSEHTSFESHYGEAEAVQNDSPEISDISEPRNETESAQDDAQEAPQHEESTPEAAWDALSASDVANEGDPGSVAEASAEHAESTEHAESAEHEASTEHEPGSTDSVDVPDADIENDTPDNSDSDSVADDVAADPAAGDQGFEVAEAAPAEGGTGDVVDEAEAGVVGADSGSDAQHEDRGIETPPEEPGSAEAPASTQPEEAAPEHESTVAETLAAGHAPKAEPIAASALDDTPLARELAEITRRRQALNAQSLPLPAAPRIFTVANQKGGVGKTTTTVNLAAALARGGARVLVIDLDPQGNASTALGVEHRADTVSVYDVIINDEPMSEVVQKSPEFAGLYCVPATIHLAGAEIELVSLVAREQRLRTALDLFLSEAEEPFHYVFIDCPPSLGLLTINAFVAAREVLIPIQCEYYALEGLSQLLSNIQLIERHLNPRLEVSTILLTMYDGRTNLANQVADDVREHFPREVLDTLIPRSVRISEAPSYGQSVISYDPSSPGSLSYLEAAAEIAKRGAPA